MNISEHLRKQYWRRRVNADTEVPPPANATYYVDDIQPTPGEFFRNMTNADFLNEIEAGAHEINSKYWSMRPIKTWVELLDDKGQPVRDKNGKIKKVLKIIGFEDMETTRCALPQRFAIAKASHAAADGFWIGNSSKKHKEIFPNLLDWKDAAGLDAALFEVVLSLTHCCDAALYLYVEGEAITYKVFSYLYGDELFDDFDEKRRPRVWRRYSLRGKNAVDVISAGNDGYQTWVQDDLDETHGTEGMKSWWQRVKSWFHSADKVLSEDGWRRIARSDSQIGEKLCQCIYFRVNDIPSGRVADEIGSWERLASYVAESMKSTAFPDKFVKATKIKNLPSADAHGRIYGVEGNVDELKAADMKTIAPGDMSNIATTTLDTKMKSIMHGSMSVIIEPEILKSGADSSSALRLMFTSEIQDAQAFWIKIVPQVRYMVEVFKTLVAKVEEDGNYTKIRTSVQQRIWVPQNVSENVDNTTKLVYAGILSKKDGASEVDLQYPDSEETIRKEQEQELYYKTFIPLKAKADATAQFGLTDTAEDVIVSENDNPNKPKPETGAPKVDNNASRRDIASNERK